jgi:hypothetical protein
MGKMDYTKFAKNRPEVKPTPVEPVEIIKPDEPEIINVFGVVEKVKHTIGVVDNCVKLNVRKNPNRHSEVLGVIDKGAEVIIDEANSTVNLYKICTATGIEGYCMKDYIVVKK